MNREAQGLVAQGLGTSREARRTLLLYYSLEKYECASPHCIASPHMEAGGNTMDLNLNSAPAPFRLKPLSCYVIVGFLSSCPFALSPQRP